jgi:hypothetical protein
MRRRKGRLAKILSVPVLAFCGFAVAATLAGVGLAGVKSSSTTTTTEPPTTTTAPTTTTTTTTTTAPPVGEGCTPGFWKNNAAKHDAVRWPMGFEPGDLVGDVFMDAPDSVAGLTLLEGLRLRGGGVNALTRHAIAAVLNAAHPGIDFGIADPDDVVALVNDAFASEDAAEIEAAKDLLAGFNRAGCGLSQNL